MKKKDKVGSFTLAPEDMLDVKEEINKTLSGNKELREASKTLACLSGYFADSDIEFCITLSGGEKNKTYRITIQYVKDEEKGATV